MLKLDLGETFFVILVSVITVMSNFLLVLLKKVSSHQFLVIH